MGLFDKVGSFLKREAKDLGDAAEGAKDRLDSELSKREQELQMTPSEKIAALQQQASVTDAQLDAIADKTTGRDALADAVAEVGAISADASLPNITHIVLPDGRVRSGNDIPKHVVDDKGTVHEVPVVEAPTTDDLEKFDPPATIPSPVDQATTANAVDEVLDAGAADGGETAEPSSPSAAMVTTDEPDLPPPPAAAVTEQPDESPASGADEPDDNESDDPTKNLSNPDYGKTPAQIKYEQARAAANDLLSELRGELKDDGQL